MNSILVCCRRVGALGAALSVLLVCFVASASAQDLAVTKSTESSVVAAGSNVTYQVTVSSNTGSTGQTTLTDVVPANMTFVSASFPDPWSCELPTVGSGGTVTCTHPGDIPDETVYTFTFVFQVVPGTQNGTEITNTANISNAADNNSLNNTSSSEVTVGDPPPPPPPPLLPKDVLISEFRLSGPEGSEDDFIELYCNRDTDCDISGAFLRAHDPVNVGEFALTFPSQSIIPARQYFLVADSRGYSLETYGFPDIDVAFEQPPEPEPPFYFYDNEGIQLVTGGDPVIIDSVGFTGGGNDFLYVEGSGLQRASSRPDDQYAYVRKRTLETNGLPQDTNNNAADFVLVSVTGNEHAGITALPVLGAPGPQGLFSPYSYNNVQVSATLVDETKTKDEAPNRVRDGSGDSGTLSIRRSVTNNTNDTFEYMAFRVIEITTLNSPQTMTPPQAELRLISSPETSAEVPSRSPSVIPIYGTVLEYDASCLCAEPQQPNGGGLNSTVYLDNSEGSVAPDQRVDVQFLLNVVKAGTYRFFVYVEAIPGQSEIEARTPGGRSSRIRTKPAQPRKFAKMQRLGLVGNQVKLQTPVITPMTKTPLTTGVRPSKPVPAAVVTTPRAIIINRAIPDSPKKPRKRTRVRRKNSAALKRKVEERFATERPQN